MCLCNTAAAALGVKGQALQPFYPVHCMPREEPSSLMSHLFILEILSFHVCSCSGEAGPAC